MSGQIKNKDKTIPKGDMEGNEEARGLELKSKEGGLHRYFPMQDHKECACLGLVVFFCFVLFAFLVHLIFFPLKNQMRMGFSTKFLPLVLPSAQDHCLHHSCLYCLPFLK